MKRVALAVVASCASPAPPAPIHNAPPIVRATVTAVEGRVVDSVTGAALPGIGVEAAVGASSDDAFTDEHGRFHLEIDGGSAYMQLEYGSGSWIPVAANQITQHDLRMDHAEVVQRAHRRPPIACPHSPPGTVIVGHSTPQAELDAIAHRVLERYAADPKAVPDSGPAAAKFVRTDLDFHRSLTAAAVPARFVGKTRVELVAESKRLGSDVDYVDVRSIDADPTCAIVWVGIDFIVASPSNAIKMCCCTAAELYELRNGQWEFVGDAEHICS
jgi:hypothetical protein